MENNLQKLENLLNKNEQGVIINDCCDFILRFLLGQVDNTYEILDRYLSKSMSEKEKKKYIKKFAEKLYERADKSTNINQDLNIDNFQTIDKNKKNYDDIYNCIKIGELLLCNWNDCWDIDCWETRKGFCNMDHKDKSLRGNRPKIKLSKRE